MKKPFSIALTNVQGSATFSGKPNKKQIAAVNHLAETAYKELSKLPKNKLDEKKEVISKDNGREQPLLNSIKIGNNEMLTTDDFKGKNQIILNVSNETNKSKDFILFSCLAENNEGIDSGYSNILYSEIIEYIKVNKILICLLYIKKVSSKVQNFLRHKYVMNYITKTPYGELYDARIIFDNNNPTKEVGPLSVAFELSVLTSIKLTLPQKTVIQLRFFISR